MVQNMLINKLHQLNINFDKFDESKKLLEDLNRQFREIEIFQNDPEFYIDEYCRELTRQVDLRREQLFESIGQYSERLVMQIDEWKSGLLTKAKENYTRIGEQKVEECKARLGQLNLMFETLEIDNMKSEEILNQKASKELEKLIKSIAEVHKRELLEGKTYGLKTHDIKMEEVFGTLKMGQVSFQMEVMLLVKEKFNIRYQL